MSYSIIFLGLCILVGSWFILQSIQSNQFKTSQKEQFRYELISPNDSNIIIFDKQSGDYFSKYIEPNEGPTEWQKQKSPISTSPKLIWDFIELWNALCTRTAAELGGYFFVELQGQVSEIR